MNVFDILSTILTAFAVILGGSFLMVIARFFIDDDS